MFKILNIKSKILNIKLEEEGGGHRMDVVIAVTTRATMALTSGDDGGGRGDGSGGNGGTGNTGGISSVMVSGNVIAGANGGVGGAGGNAGSGSRGGNGGNNGPTGTPIYASGVTSSNNSPVISNAIGGANLEGFANGVNGTNGYVRVYLHYQ